MQNKIVLNFHFRPRLPSRQPCHVAEKALRCCQERFSVLSRTCLNCLLCASRFAGARRRFQQDGSRSFDDTKVRILRKTCKLECKIFVKKAHLLTSLCTLDLHFLPLSVFPLSLHFPVNSRQNVTFVTLVTLILGYPPHQQKVTSISIYMIYYNISYK